MLYNPNPSNDYCCSQNISNIPLSNLRIVLPDGNVMTLLSTSLDLRPTVFRSKGCIGGDSSM